LLIARERKRDQSPEVRQVLCSSQKKLLLLADCWRRKKGSKSDNNCYSLLIAREGKEVRYICETGLTDICPFKNELQFLDDC